MGKAWSSKQPVIFNDITEKDMPSRYKQAKEAGLRSGVILPVMYNDKPFALLKVFNADNTARLNKEELVELMHFAGGIVAAGMYRKGKMPTFAHAPAHLPRQQMVEVYAMISREEVFNSNLVYHEVDWFYNLGLQKYYFRAIRPHPRSPTTSTHSSQPRRSQPPPDARRTSSSTSRASRSMAAQCGCTCVLSSMTGRWRWRSECRVR